MRKGSAIKVLLLCLSTAGCMLSIWTCLGNAIGDAVFYRALG